METHPGFQTMVSPTKNTESQKCVCVGRGEGCTIVHGVKIQMFWCERIWMTWELKPGLLALFQMFYQLLTPGPHWSITLLDASNQQYYICEAINVCV